MSSAASCEGLAPFAVPGAGRTCFTWYKIFGELNKTAGSVPLIALHEGPGAGHEYLLSLEDLWNKHGKTVVLYDQIGCGRSTALREKNGDKSFWSVELFEREIDNLIKHLGIVEFDLFGHSWGGMLASVYAAKQPRGLRKLILMGAPASVELVLRGSAELRGQLPQDTQDTMKRHEAEMDFDAPAYKAACLEFYNRFLCRCEPWPQQLVESMSHLEEDPTVYGTMFGPSELICTGNLKGWTAITEAHKIQSTTLLINGEFDETVEYATAPYFEEIPKVKWVFLPGASHMGMWEARERCIQIVHEFLASKS